MVVYERLIPYRFDQENVALDGLSFMGGCPLQTFTQVARYNIKHLLTGPEGNKINYFLRDQSLSDLLYGWKFIKPRCNGGRRSTIAGNSAMLPSDVIDFTMRPLRDFDGKRFYC